MPEARPPGLILAVMSSVHMHVTDGHAALIRKIVFETDGAFIYTNSELLMSYYLNQRRSVCNVGDSQPNQAILWVQVHGGITSILRARKLQLLVQHICPDSQCRERGYIDTFTFQL